MRSDEQIFGHFRCPDALRRDGLTLAGMFDLSPIVRQLGDGGEIAFTVDYPRLGFEELSPPLKTDFSGSRLIQSRRIQAGAVEPIRVRFGYSSKRLAGACAALFALALAIFLAAALVCYRGLPHLHRSVFMLGAIEWLAVVWRLEATEPLKILLAGTPLAVLASTMLEFLPPLFCVAMGVATGSRNRAGSTQGARFQETFWGYAFFVFPLASVLAAVPFLAEEGGWREAVPWLAVAMISIIVCRRRMGGIFGNALRQITTGPLSERVAELAAKAGQKQARLHVSQSARSQVLNAFALFGAALC